MSRSLELKINPEYESLLPKLPKKEYEDLKFSIKQNGLHFPITVNDKGVILDGHHRYRICRELSIEPRWQVKTFSNHLLEKKFVIEANLRRRHLNDFQRVELAYPLEGIERELARQRQGTRTDLGKKLTSGSNEHKVGRARDIVAKRVGVSPTTYQRAKNVIEKGSEELKERLRKGKTSINRAYLSILIREREHAIRERYSSHNPTPLPREKHPLARPGWEAWGLLGEKEGAYLDTDKGCWRADYSPAYGHIVDLSYAYTMAHNSRFSRLERIKQSLIWNYFYNLPEEDITNYTAKVNSKARERVEYVANQILRMRKDNRERKNRETILKEKVEELYAKFKQLTVEFTDGTTIPLNLKLLEWADVYFRRGRKWIESSLKQNILPALAKEMLGFDERGYLLTNEKSDLS